MPKLFGTLSSSSSSSKELSIESRVVCRDDYYKIECSICLSILENPRQCSSDCISFIVAKDNAECPLCRTSLQGLSRNLLAESMLRDLKIYCINHFRFNKGNMEWEHCQDSEMACQEHTTVEKSQEHLQQCQFTLRKCPLQENGCDVELLGVPMQNHIKEECKYRIVPCTYCQSTMKASELDTHMSETCLEYILECPDKCGSTFKRNESDGHQRVCPNFIIPCILGNQICNFMGKRKDMNQHVMESLSIHMQSLAISNQNVIKENERMRQEINLLNKKIDNLEDYCDNLQDKSYFTYEWIIKDFNHNNSVVDTTSFESKEFMLGPFKWRLQIKQNNRYDYGLLIYILDEIDANMEINLDCWFQIVVVDGGCKPINLYSGKDAKFNTNNRFFGFKNSISKMDIKKKESVSIQQQYLKDMNKTILLVLVSVLLILTISHSTTVVFAIENDKQYRPPKNQTHHHPGHGHTKGDSAFSKCERVTEHGIIGCPAFQMPSGCTEIRLPHLPYPRCCPRPNCGNGQNNGGWRHNQTQKPK
ncbi:hypothetical protein DFA_02794 [Cavenderia fasciculata]|uniref:TRAF-type zinc finger-containing protein n=1 Tax=Cavenderia fasciculata TaxID=261658 RepID=F4PIB7_CACFS|nr:uncharacterized protein DFA_02794 [Cavenderia fasciculata]EGG24551.1 hypothetical protein DFA_02794 [Cavenderia fasciculata]|eukprot:XP_004362402.1 hypothetical protein DFA_02794 [Cavenderia fasciculata]